MPGIPPRGESCYAPQKTLRDGHRVRRKYCFPARAMQVLPERHGTPFPTRRAGRSFRPGHCNPAGPRGSPRIPAPCPPFATREPGTVPPTPGTFSSSWSSSTSSNSPTARSSRSSPSGRLGPAAPDRVGHGVLEPHDRALRPRARLRTARSRAHRRRGGRGERRARGLLAPLGLVSQREARGRARLLLERHLYRRWPRPRNRRAHRGPLGRGVSGRDGPVFSARLAGGVSRRGPSRPPPRALGAQSRGAPARRLRSAAGSRRAASASALHARDLIPPAAFHALLSRAGGRGSARPRGQPRSGSRPRARGRGSHPAPRHGAAMDRAGRRALFGLLVDPGAEAEEPRGLRYRLPQPAASPVERRFRTRDVWDVLDELLDRAVLPSRPPPRRGASRPPSRGDARGGRLSGRVVRRPPRRRLAPQDAPRPAVRRRPDRRALDSFRLRSSLAPLVLGGSPPELPRRRPHRSLDRARRVHGAGARAAAAEGHRVRGLHPPHDDSRPRARPLYDRAPQRLHGRPQVGAPSGAAGPGGRGGPPLPRRPAAPPGVIPFGA